MATARVVFASLNADSSKVTVKVEIQQWGDIGTKLEVSDNRCYVGFNAYQQLIESELDLVILATPPGFRPMMIEAAVGGTYPTV